MPYISTEALVGATLVVALALGYQYIPLPSSLAQRGGSSNSKKKKNKKKSSKSTAGSGSRDDTPVIAKLSSDSEARKESEDVKPGQAAPKPKTLAQKIAPQPRKTKVDDMLAPEDLPGQHARVMRVAGSSTTATGPPALAPPVAQSEGKVKKFSEDYASSSSSSSSGSEEDEADNTSARVPKAAGRKKQDDGWGVVSSKKKKPVSISFSSSNPQASTSLALPTATKVQRKNQKKAEIKKATKAAEEEERLRRLAMHKRQLEKAKIDDLYSGKKKGSSGAGGGQFSVGSGPGTSKASLDHNGKLIWD